MIHISKVTIQEATERWVSEMNAMEYTIEMCPNCMTEQVIYSKGITPCSNCGHPLAPCSVCESCNYDTCPYGCDGTENDSYKRATNPVIPENLQEKLYSEL